MVVYIGSARHDENGKYVGGKAGDQRQVSAVFDTLGEVSIQTEADFVKNRKWYVIRPKQAIHAIKMAERMLKLCNNPYYGYDQNQRLGVITYGIDAKRNSECDCSSAVRACAKEATGKDPGNFTTKEEADCLVRTGLFDKPIVYRAGMTLYEGDVLVTQTKGHTGIVVQGASRSTQTGGTTGAYIYGGVDYSPVFNPVYYANRHKAKEPVFGTMTNAQLFKHFCDYGMKERRQACLNFNVDIYRERYTDLKGAFGDDFPAYYKHYCILGRFEGRTGI